MKPSYLLPVIDFEPTVMERGAGSWIWDTQDKRYLDLNSGQFCTVLGHCNAEVLQRIKTAMDRLSHTSSGILASEVIACAEKLHEISGDMAASSILLSTGAESVEFAIRYSKHLQKKSGIICFDKGYHGLTLGTQSVTFGGKYAYPAVENVYTTPVPASLSEEDACLAQLETLLKRVSAATAAVLMEPVVSVGGMMFPSARYFRRVRELCDQYGLYLIFDESQTGFGRLGTWLAGQGLGVTPDMVCLAKGIGLGYPVAAVLFRSTLVKQDPFAMTHYSSHQNDPFAASIVNTGIDYIRQHDILTGVVEKGEYFLNRLTSLCEKNPYLQAPRGKGLMLGADLQYPGTEDYRSVYHRLHAEMLHRGVIIQGTSGGRVLRFLPDYLISHDDIDFALDTLEQALAAVAPDA